MPRSKIGGISMIKTLPVEETNYNSMGAGPEVLIR
jgi:hypothetical protein